MTDSSPTPSPPPSYVELSTPGVPIVTIGSSDDSAPPVFTISSSSDDSVLRNPDSRSELDVDVEGSILGELFREDKPPPSYEEAADNKVGSEGIYMDCGSLPTPED